ncbi:hypothetical protein Tco_0742756 [Tanacetum coccineum]
MIKKVCELDGKGQLQLWSLMLPVNTDMGIMYFHKQKAVQSLERTTLVGNRIFWAKTKQSKGRVKRSINKRKKTNTYVPGQHLLNTLMMADGRFLLDHVMKTLATNHGIPMRAIPDQMQKQFDVGVLKMKAFKAKRIITNKMTSSFRENYSLLREYAQELINQNTSTTVRIDIQKEPNPDSPTRTFRMVYCVRKGCRGQGGASQAGGSSQADGSRNASSQATGSSQPSATPSTTTGARNASGENVGSSKPSATPSTASQVPSQHSSGPTQAYQRPRKGFQAPRLALSYGPQRLTKKIASRHNPRKFPS